MNKIIQIKLKYIVVFLVFFLAILVPHFKSDQVPPTTTEITTTKTVKNIKKVDSIFKDVSANRPIKTIAYLVDSITNSVRKKPSVTSVLLQKKETEKEVNAQVFTQNFKLKNANAVLKYVSPERVFGLDLKVFTNNQLITETTATKITKYVVPNAWFINLEPKFSVLPTPAIIGGGVSFDYTIKNKIRLGAGIEFNTMMPKNSQFLLNLKLGIKL